MINSNGNSAGETIQDIERRLRLEGLLDDGPLPRNQNTDEIKFIELESSGIQFLDSKKMVLQRLPSGENQYRLLVTESSHPQYTPGKTIDMGHVMIAYEQGYDIRLLAFKQR